MFLGDFKSFPVITYCSAVFPFAGQELSVTQIGFNQCGIVRITVYDRSLKISLGLSVFAECGEYVAVKGVGVVYVSIVCVKCRCLFSIDEGRCM